MDYIKKIQGTRALTAIGAVLGVAALALAGCRQPSNAPGDRSIEPEAHDQALITQWQVTGPVQAAGSIINQDITIVLPGGAALTGITSVVTMSPGASVNPDPAAETDFSGGPVTFTVTAANGATSTRYTVAARHQTADDKAITAFTINGAAGVIDHENGSISVVIAGDSLDNLAPDILYTGTSLSPRSGEPQNFSSGPVDYIVMAQDGSSRRYKASVVSAQKVAKEITSFKLGDAQDVDAQQATITNTGANAGLITITVPEGTAITHITATVSHTGASIAPLPGEPRDFSKAVSYEVRAEDGSVRVYLVQVTVAPASGNDITRFSLTHAQGTNLAEIHGTDISVTVPFNTDLASLTPDIAVSVGAAVSPASGVARDFTAAAAYTVTAKNGAKKTYTVTVIKAANDAKSITAFHVPQAVTAIDGSFNITVTLPFGAAKTSLTPAISHTGVSINPASGAAADFTNPVTYTVTAGDGSARAYLVTVVNAALQNVLFSGVAANGASWTTETTELTLTFDKDMGSALTAADITVSGGIVKGALSQPFPGGVYKLAVSAIPANETVISVLAASPTGYNITGSPGTKVYKPAEALAFKKLTQEGGKSAKAATKKLVFEFDKDIPGFTAGDITLAPAAGFSVTKGELVRVDHGVYELALGSIGANNLEVTVTPKKAGFAFIPALLKETVYKEANTDATLSSLQVGGRNLIGFGPGTLTYTYGTPGAPVSDETVPITATVSDPKAAIKYLARPSDTIVSGAAFISQAFAAGSQTEVKIEVTAEDRKTTMEYTIAAYRGSNDANLRGITLTPASGVACAVYPAPAASIPDYALYATAFNTVIRVTPSAHPKAAIAISNNAGSPYVDVPHSNDAGTMNGVAADMAEHVMPAFSTITIKITAEDGKTQKTYTISRYAKTASAGGRIPQAKGGQITFVDNDEIHTFSTGTANTELTDTLTFLMPGNMPATARVLLLGGGGREGEGYIGSGATTIFNFYTGGGGGGGQVVEDKAFKLNGVSSYAVTVGKRTGTYSEKGTASKFGGSLTAAGGGGGWKGGTYDTVNGMFSMGGRIVNGVPQGGNGGEKGQGGSRAIYYGSGGGAGSLGNGGNGVSGNQNDYYGGAGGAGVESTITGSAIAYGKGGPGGNGWTINGSGGNTDRANGNGVVIVRFTQK